VKGVLLRTVVLAKYRPTALPSSSYSGCKSRMRHDAVPEHTNTIHVGWRQVPHLFGARTCTKVQQQQSSGSESGRAIRITSCVLRARSNAPSACASTTHQPKATPVPRMQTCRHSRSSLFIAWLFHCPLGLRFSRGRLKRSTMRRLYLMTMLNKVAHRVIA